MSRVLGRKYLAESWLMLLAIAFGVVLFCWFRVWIVGELDTAQFRQIIDLLPKDWRKFASVDFDWLVSYLGRTSLTLDEPMLVMFITGWAMVRGSDVVSGELSRGTMEMLLSQPVSRRNVYMTHAFWTMLLLLLLILLAWASMSLGIWTTSVEESTYPEIRIPIIDYRIPLSFLAPQTQTIAMASEVNPFLFCRVWSICFVWDFSLEDLQRFVLLATVTVGELWESWWHFILPMPASNCWGWLPRHFSWLVNCQRIRFLFSGFGN